MIMIMFVSKQWIGLHFMAIKNMENHVWIMEDQFVTDSLDSWGIGDPSWKWFRWSKPVVYLLRISYTLNSGKIG
jgi:hypothetical protein